MTPWQEHPLGSGCSDQQGEKTKCALSLAKVREKDPEKQIETRKKEEPKGNTIHQNNAKYVNLK